jgi:hypothetical protein
VGADYKGQDKAIKELRELSEDAKKYISHHFRNALTQILGGIKTNKLDIAKKAAWHMVEDLEKIGC